MNADAYIKALGLAFRRRREELGMTNEQVAEKAGMNVNYYARIERGEINTSVRKLVAISNALKAELSQLTGQAENSLGKQ